MKGIRKKLGVPVSVAPAIASGRNWLKSGNRWYLAFYGFNCTKTMKTVNRLFPYALHKLNNIFQARFRSSIIFSTIGRKIISIAKPIMPPGMTIEL